MTNTTPGPFSYIGIYKRSLQLVDGERWKIILVQLPVMFIACICWFVFMTLPLLNHHSGALAASGLPHSKPGMWLFNICLYCFLSYLYLYYSNLIRSKSLNQKVKFFYGRVWRDIIGAVIITFITMGLIYLIDFGCAFVFGFIFAYVKVATTHVAATVPESVAAGASSMVLSIPLTLVLVWFKLFCIMHRVYTRCSWWRAICFATKNFNSYSWRCMLWFLAAFFVLIIIGAALYLFGMAISYGVGLLVPFVGHAAVVISNFILIAALVVFGLWLAVRYFMTIIVFWGAIYLDRFVPEKTAVPS